MKKIKAEKPIKIVSCGRRTVSVVVAWFIFAAVPALLTLKFSDAMLWACALIPIMTAAFFVSVTAFSKIVFFGYGLIVSGDKLFARPVQNEYAIYYDDIVSALPSELPLGYDSDGVAFAPTFYNLSVRPFFTYGHNSVKTICLTLRDGSRRHIILSRYSERQIEKIVSIINSKTKKPSGMPK